MSSDVVLDGTFDLAALSDEGTERDHNEDRCAVLVDSGDTAVAVIADGVSSYPAGEVASQMAVDGVLRAFAELPASTPLVKRLARAVQQANIEIYDLSLVVPELRGMATTATVLAVRGAELAAAHVGDCRLLQVRDGVATQLTKDHTVAGERERLRLLRKGRASQHPGRFLLTRSLGRELIVAVDQLTTDVDSGDTLILCSDGLHSVLPESEMARLVAEGSASVACRALIDAANGAGTPDNVSAAVLRLIQVSGRPAGRRGWLERLTKRATHRWTKMP